MPVKHAVLGLLVERRGYGYELASRLNERLGPGFGIPVGTVHASLKTLKDDGHAVVAETVRNGGQLRVYYASTPSGELHFEEWMGEPLTRDPLRGEVFLKCALATTAGLPRLREEFERLELECVSDIARNTRSRRLVDEVTDPVPLDTALRWVLDSAVLDDLNGDLAFIRRTLSVFRMAEAEGMVPRAMLLEAVSSSG